MVDHVLRLKLALLASAFRPGATLARTFAVLLASGAVGAALLMLSAQVDVAAAGHRATIVIVGSAVSLALVVAPLSAGLGSAMEPRRFAMYPIQPRTLALGLGLAGAIGVPGILAALLGISLERSWGGTSSVPAAVAAAVLATVAIVVTSQYLVAIAAQLSVSRVAVRVITMTARLVLVVALAVAALAVMMATNGADDDTLVSIAAALGNTPMGMLWAAPEGPLAALLARLLGGVIMVAVLVLGWGWVVARLIEAPHRSSDVTPRAGLGWFDLVPASPAGVIAARSLLYWTRDSRYRSVILGLPLAPVLMMLAFALAGAPLPPLWLVPLPVLALFLGWFSHNDTAYDHSAIWVHVSAQFSGAADRWGRAVPPLLLGLPIILGLAPLFVVWSGVEGALPALIGVSIGTLLTGLGVSSVSSALLVYPAARPGAGPFDQPPTLGARAGWAQSVSLLVIVALMAPTLAVAIMGFTEPEWFSTAAIAGAVTGVVALVVGVAAGGRVFRRRAPELLNEALRS